MAEATYTAGHEDEAGYVYCPLSDCCGAAVVYFHDGMQHFLRWSGRGTKPATLWCEECNKTLKAAKAEGGE